MNLMSALKQPTICKSKMNRNKIFTPRIVKSEEGKFFKV